MSELVVAEVALVAEGADLADLALLSDADLLARQDALVEQRRRVDARLAQVVGAIARRSSRDAGLGGLAQRNGFRTAAEFIATTAGLSRHEASALVRVADAAAVTPTVAAAVAAGEVSVAAADAIVRGLGPAGGHIDADVLDVAAGQLLASAGECSPDALAHAARDLRAILDADTVIERERHLRSRRFLRMSAQSDGMTLLTALLDPESAALVRAVFDAITAPRRGGPRFVTDTDQERARSLERDPRSTEQLALDAFIDLLRLGADVDPGAITGTRLPAVRVHVTDADLRARGMTLPGRSTLLSPAPAAGTAGMPAATAGLGELLGSGTDGHAPPGADPTRHDPETATGFARLEGQSVLVSTATAQRYVCTSGTVPILFDHDGQVVNVGRDHRLFTHRQRIGLAARDGGCVWPGCDRPPSWCEAHHIDEWDAHHGHTNIADGVLLCRFHHLLVHDRNWRIHRDTTTAVHTGIEHTETASALPDTTPPAAGASGVDFSGAGASGAGTGGTGTSGTGRSGAGAAGVGVSGSSASGAGRVRYWARRDPTGPPGRSPVGRHPTAHPALEPEFVELQTRPPIRHGPG
jgi:hypothetical protein